jgi:NitT/TauT family transport system permease protein
MEFSNSPVAKAVVGSAATTFPGEAVTSQSDPERSRGVPGWLVKLCFAALILGVWQLTARFMNKLAVAPPWAILESVLRTFTHGPDGSLIAAFGVTMLDLLIGFGASLVIGVSLGLVAGNYRLLGRFIDPIVSLGNSSPTIAVLPLMIIWLGFGRPARVLFIGVVSVWAIIINTSIGARLARERYADLIPAFSVPRRIFLLRIVTPSALPYILTGVRVALAHALIAAIISGQEIGQSGIGGLASQYGTQFDTANLFGVIVLTTAAALLLYRMLEVIRRHSCRWVEWVR